MTAGCEVSIGAVYQFMAMVAGGLLTVRASHGYASFRHFGSRGPERVVRHVFFSQVYGAVANRLFAPFTVDRPFSHFLRFLSFQCLTNSVIKAVRYCTDLKIGTYLLFENGKKDQINDPSARIGTMSQMWRTHWKTLRTVLRLGYA
jgi:hypothetical protein